MFRGCTNVELLIVKAKTAPTVYGSYTFGYSSDWIGYNYKGTNVLYVPNESTGYDTGS
jgi:hypothetical protein